MRTALWAIGLAAGTLAIFVAVAGDPTPGRFFLFLAGQAAVLASGSALFIALYAHLLGRAVRPVWRGPLTAVSEHKRLFAWMHVAVFGLLTAGMVASYECPAIQEKVLGHVMRQGRRPETPLGMAWAAYRTGSVPVAAAATLAVNFLVGALAGITIMSLLLPGLGVVVILGRACVVGLALAPTSPRLFHAMAWHTGTILVEMEAYILAAFFGLLVAVYLFRPKEGQTLRGRYVKALWLNARGALLVLIILAVAASYEATEVMLQMP